MFITPLQESLMITVMTHFDDRQRQPSAESYASRLDEVFTLEEYDYKVG